MNFVPIEIAEQLKELGFNRPCIAYYTFATQKLIASIDSGHNFEPITHGNIYKDYFLAPTINDIIFWFEDEFSLFSEIEIDRTMEPKYCFTINYYNEGEYLDVTNREQMFLYYRRAEAELACIKRLITIIKNKEL